VTRSALLIATNEYSDSELKALESPAGDAATLAELLADPAIGEFDVEPMLHDEPSHVLLEGIEDFFADRKRDDVLFLYLSCHGVKDLPGRLYFASSNTRRDRLAGTAVAASWLAERMIESHSRQIVTVLDCCHSGAIAKHAIAKADRRVGVMDQLQMEDQHRRRGRGRVVLTATDSIGYAFEAGDVERVGEIRSIFTAALIEGLRTGEADLDGDRRISVNELYDYVHDRVTEETPDQTPGKCSVGLEQGDIMVAWHKRTSALAPSEVDLESHSAARPVDPGASQAYVEQLNERISSAHHNYAVGAAPGQSYWAIQLAEGLKQRGDNAGAEAAYRAALHTATSPAQIAEAGAGLGDLLKRLKRHEEAAEAYRDVIAAGATPRRRDAWFSLAEVLDAQGRADEVVSTYREAAGAGVDEAWLRLARYFSAKERYGEAAEAFHEATGVGSASQRREAWMGLAEVSMKLGDHEQVILSFTRAADLGEHKALLKLGSYFEKLGAVDHAVHAYRRAELVGQGAGLHLGRRRTARKARKALKALGATELAS
jgi:tetratricopeptide (TPR) repeat protein